MKPSLLLFGIARIEVGATTCDSPGLSTTVKLVLALGAFLVAACSTIGEKAENKLVGKWHSSDRSGNTAIYEFLGNGTFSGSVKTEDGVVMSQYTGKWKFSAGAILYQYTSDKTGRIRPGTRDHDKVLKIERDYFVIEAADGSVRRYLRASSG